MAGVSTCKFDFQNLFTSAQPRRHSIMPMTSAVANQMLVSACNCHLELIMSVHVRHRRFDTLLYALRSYAPLPLEHVYLYFELDAQLANRSVELKTAAEQLFGSRSP